MFFTYGGGLQTGDRNLVIYNNLAYGNLGAFFAKRGYLTIIADYRLSVVGDPNRSKYPECSQDANDALSWVVSNPEINKVADTNKVFIQGHSAGGMIQASLLLHPTMVSDDLRSRIKGAIWNGTPYHFETSPPAMPFQNYFGTEGGEKKQSAFGLLKSAPDAVVASLPPLLIITAEKELVPIVQTTKDFVKVLKERNGPEVTEYENAGHNHISSVSSLSSGEGEQWGHDVVQWMQAH
jgi:acetyl esterase/lipase